MTATTLSQYPSPPWQLLPLIPPFPVLAPLAAQTLGEAMGPALVTSRLLPAIAQLARDAVPNVRFNVAKALQQLARSTLREAPALRDVVRPCLAQLAGDADADVRYFAARALASL